MFESHGFERTRRLGERHWVVFKVVPGASHSDCEPTLAAKDGGAPTVNRRLDATALLSQSVQSSGNTRSHARVEAPESIQRGAVAKFSNVVSVLMCPLEARYHGAAPQ